MDLPARRHPAERHARWELPHLRDGPRWARREDRRQRDAALPVALRVSFLAFLTSTCAIVGGVFTLSGVAEGLAFRATRLLAASSSSDDAAASEPVERGSADMRRALQEPDADVPNPGIKRSKKVHDIR